MIHCDAAGAFKLEGCPAGQQCSMIGGKAHCATATCPATGKADVCGSKKAIGHCLGGSIVSSTACKPDEVCVSDGSGPRCVRNPEVVSDPGEAPLEQTPDPDVASADMTGSCSMSTSSPSNDGSRTGLVLSLALAFVGLGRRRRQ